MPRWTVGRDDQQVIIEVTGSAITLDIPARQPVDLDPASAADIRTKIGFAINVAVGDGPAEGSARP